MPKFTEIKNMYVFDLESCDGEWLPWEEVPRQRVWLCGYMNIEKQEMIHFTSHAQALESMLKLGGNMNVEIGVHNLAFDGSFIVPQLVQLGYDPVSGKPGIGQFSVLIDDRNNWYSIQVQVTPKRKVIFWDTLKLFPMALKHLHQVYHTQTQKLIEDSEFYETVRDETHVPTEQELTYLKHDLLVLAETLMKHIALNGLGFKKTQASQAFYNFAGTFKAWKLRFPALVDQVDQDVRVAYWGGISYVNPKYEGLDLENVLAYDINSSYPYQIAHKKMPYGPMILSLGEGEHPAMNYFWVAKAIVRFTLKPNKIPCIPKKAIEQQEYFPGVKWMTTSDGLVELTFSSVDYKTIQSSYEFEVIDWIWSYHWAHKVHTELQRYINTNNEDKITYKELAKKTSSDERYEYLARSQRAKINNNSFYGKFGEEIIKYGKTPVVEDDIVHYVEDREEILSIFKRKFLPLAIATTAYGRQQFVQLANIMGPTFVYGDTDSCHFLESGKDRLDAAVKLEMIKLHDLELGCWSYDVKYTKARYLRPKTYMGLKDGVWNVTCAGLPADKDAQPGEKKRSCITWENFHIGTIIHDGNGKLRTISTPTGKKLVPTSFEIGGNALFEF